MRAWLFLAALLLAGCDDPLAYPQDIDRLRVLGARVTVDGDASRAWPGPGEPVSLEWLVVDPEPAPLLGWTFEACPTIAVSRGAPVCSGAVFASASAPAVSSEPPRFDFTPPSGASSVLVRGLVCRDAIVAGLGAGCAGQHERVVFEVRVGGDNANPSAADAQLFLGETPWPVPSDAAATSCAPEDLQATSGQTLALRAALDESDREAVNGPSAEAPPREPLLVSHYSTHGRLARALSVIEGASDDLEVAVPWRAPGGASGERARFYFVLRDGRGGVDWATRTLCLMP